MLEQLRSVTKIYDLFALCASYIIKECESNPYEFELFDEDQYDNVFDMFDEYAYNLQKIGSVKAFNNLKNKIVSYLKSGITIEKIFALVKFMDEFVEIDLDGELIGAGRSIIKYSAMNTQYQDFVKIIPKMKQTLLDRAEVQFKSVVNSEYSLFRKKMECPCSILDKEMSNYTIWDKDKIKKYPFTIYHLGENHPLTKYFFKNEKVIFGIVPLTKEKIENILEIEYDKKLFSIKDMYESAEEDLKERYEKACKKSKENKIDFLVFPEMLLTKDIIFSSDENDAVNQLIVNGSVSKDCVNKTIVTNGKKEELLSYCKKEPFELKIKGMTYRERLDKTKNKEYVVIEINSLGRVGVAICKDLLNEDIKLFHKYMDTNILIIPAYTASRDLYSSAESLSKDYHIIVVLANACSALEQDKEEIGFVTIPAKNKTARSNKTIIYTRKKCEDMCCGECMGKKIEIDFGTTKSDSEGLSYEINTKDF